MRKMRFKLMLWCLPVLIGLSSCEDFPWEEAVGGVTDSEVVAGLKQALAVGTDTAVTRLNKTDGFYGDQAVKILLPEEAQPVYDVLNLLPTNLVEDNILAINRAAEDAAREATPIFVDAITNLTIDDGWEILNGEDSAAINYLRRNTRQQLFDAFQPKIDVSLSKDLVLGLSANDLYSNLIGVYNKASLNGFLFDEIQTNSLSEHTTDRALRGLFMKVRDEEKLIRTDASHRVTDLLEKVFAEQD